MTHENETIGSVQYISSCPTPFLRCDYKFKPLPPHPNEVDSTIPIPQEQCSFTISWFWWHLGHSWLLRMRALSKSLAWVVCPSPSVVAPTGFLPACVAYVPCWMGSDWHENRTWDLVQLLVRYLGFKEIGLGFFVCAGFKKCIRGGFPFKLVFSVLYSVSPDRKFLLDFLYSFMWIPNTHGTCPSL